VPEVVGRRAAVHPGFAEGRLEGVGVDDESGVLAEQRVAMGVTRRGDRAWVAVGAHDPDVVVVDGTGSSSAATAIEQFADAAHRRSRRLDNVQRAAAAGAP